MIYFAASADYSRLKIGKTNREPRADGQYPRLLEISRSDSHGVTVLVTCEGYTRVETWLHRRFRRHRVERAGDGAREWFHYRSPVVRLVELLRGDPRYIQILCPDELAADLGDACAVPPAYDHAVPAQVPVVVAQRPTVDERRALNCTIPTCQPVPAAPPPQDDRTLTRQVVPGTPSPTIRRGTRERTPR